MKENTDSRILNTELIYSLDVRIPEQTPRKLEVTDRILAGIDPRNDLILVDPKIRAKHFLFRRRNNVLTVHYLGKDNDTFLNGLSLETGKLYILEKADVLKVGKIEIIIRRETGISKLTSMTNEPLPISNSKIDELAKLSDFDEIEEVTQEETNEEEDDEADPSTFIEMPMKNKKRAAIKKEPIINFSTIKLRPYKFYGFIVDIALTYFILGFAIPFLGILSVVQDFLFPISEFISHFLTTQKVEISSLKILSLIEFFICFHSIMLLGSLIFGTTPGSFLIGLHQNGANRNILKRRFKSYLYALLNIVMLPLIVFDIPLYKGRTFKEMLTFSEREINTSTFFKIIRRAVMPLFIIGSLIAPLFLPIPFSANISFEKNRKTKIKDVHSISITSFSKELGIAMNAEVNSEYELLPYFGIKKIGLLLYDFKNKKSLIMEEQNRTNISRALYKLRYANPLSSLIVPNTQITNVDLKNKSISCLELSLNTIDTDILYFGPFLANGFLFKDLFLGSFGEIDNFLINSYNKKNPVLKISTNKRDEKVFLFSKKEIIEFSVTGPKKSNLFEIFSNAVLNSLSFTQTLKNDPQSPQVLEVIDAFENSNYPLILTYYINEAKKVQELNNPEVRSLFLKNIGQTKRALTNDKSRIGMNKNIEKSFDEIISTL